MARQVLPSYANLVALLSFEPRNAQERLNAYRVHKTASSTPPRALRCRPTFNRAVTKVGLHVAASGPVKSPIPPPSSLIRKLTVYDRTTRWKVLLLRLPYNHPLPF